MIFKLFSVLDHKSGVFNKPFTEMNDSTAMRGIASCCRDESHMFHMHPRDYSLFCVGEWDDDNGTIIPQYREVCKVYEIWKPILAEIEAEIRAEERHGESQPDGASVQPRAGGGHSA